MEWLTYQFSRFGYYGSFGAGAMCYGLGFIIVHFGFKETEKEQQEKKHKRASLFSVKNLANSFKVLLKKRSGGLRHIVILLVASFLVKLVSSFLRLSSQIILVCHSVLELVVRYLWCGLPLRQEKVYRDRRGVPHLMVHSLQVNKGSLFQSYFPNHCPGLTMLWVRWSVCS